MINCNKQQNHVNKLHYLPKFSIFNCRTVMCQNVIMFKRLSSVWDFITDGSQKVNETHGAHCGGINPVRYPSVSMVDPLG